MTTRRVLAATGLAALVTGLLALPADPPVHMLSPAVACAAAGVLLWSWPEGRRYVPAAAAGVAAVSYAVTAGVLLTGPGAEAVTAPTNLWMLLEPAVLAVFAYLPVRWAPPRAALLTAGLVTLAMGASVQRYLVAEPVWESIAAGAMWTVPALGAAAAARHLRGLESARHRAVADARQRQRLDLAGDLHDFVAHDVSEIVAQAQAGRMVLAAEPRMAEVLARIENAGLRALASMDRTVGMLRDRSPAGVLADVPALAERFASPGVDVAVSVDEAALTVSRETGTVAYRVVTEALTNVRRHARGVTRVEVSITGGPDGLTVAVADDGRGPARPRGAGGFGLPGLAERVKALGGMFGAGPAGTGGWRLTAAFPAEETGRADRPDAPGKETAA